MRCEKCGKEISRYEKCTCGAENTSDSWAVIQIETNGLKPEEQAQILRIVMLDRNSNVIWNRYYRPTRLQHWDDAERVNKISPQMVSKAPILANKELESLNHRISSFDFLITNQAEFVKSFLTDAGIKAPAIVGITELFDQYMADRSIPRMNTSLNNCAAFFQYCAAAEKTAGYEKAYKIWFCYEHLAIIQKDEVLRVMGPEAKSGEMTYRLFLSEDQVLDYLKSIKVAKIDATDLPRLYYDGKFHSEPTCDIFLLGIVFRPSADETRYIVDRIVFDMKGQTIAMKEAAFVAMQERNQKKESSPLNMFEF